jgi:hypothetical protein
MKPRFKDLGGTLSERQQRLNDFRYRDVLPKVDRPFRQLANDHCKIRKSK